MAMDETRSFLTRGFAISEWGRKAHKQNLQKIWDNPVKVLFIQRKPKGDRGKERANKASRQFTTLGAFTNDQGVTNVHLSTVHFVLRDISALLDPSWSS